MTIISYKLCIAIVMAIFLICSFLCKRNMNANRGNFIFLPAWRKAVNVATNILLYSFVAAILWMEDSNQFLLIFFSSFGTIAFLIIVFWLSSLACSRLRYKGKDNEGRYIFQTTKVTRVLNKALIEYVVYAICWLSKAVLIFTSAVFLALLFAEQKLAQISCSLRCKVIEPFSVCLTICFSAGVVFSIWFLIIVLFEENMAESDENDPEYVRWQIKRNFRRSEHDV